MNVKAIEKLMKYDYAKDSNGVIIPNGALCIPANYVDFLRYEDDTAILDFSKMQIYEAKHGGMSNIVKMIAPATNGGFPIYSFECLFTLIEYFKVDEDHILPFAHQYNGINCRFWYKKEKVVKVNINDYSKIKIRYPKNYDLKVLNLSLNKEASVDQSKDYIEISIKDMKCWSYIRKTMKSIASHEIWIDKYEDFPRIFVAINDSVDNKFTYENLIDGTVDLNSYYSINAFKRFFGIYCQHPVKNHKEYLYLKEG